MLKVYSHAYMREDAYIGCMQELEPVFDKVARYFSLLSDPSRLKVIHAVCNRELSVNDVVAETGLSQSTVSRHLAALHDAGVAHRRRDANRVLYAMADPTLTDICRTVCVNLLAQEEENASLLEPLKVQANRFMNHGEESKVAMKSLAPTP